MIECKPPLRPQDAIEEDEEVEEEGRNDAGAARGRNGAPAAAAVALSRRGPPAAAVSDLAARRGAFSRALEALLELPAPPADEEASEAERAASRREWDDLKDQIFCALVDLLLISNCGALARVPGAGQEAGRAAVARLWGHVEGLLAEQEEEDGGDEDEDEDDGWEGGCLGS